MGGRWAQGRRLRQSFLRLWRQETAGGLFETDRFVATHCARDLGSVPNRLFLRRAAWEVSDLPGVSTGSGDIGIRWQHVVIAMPRA